MQWINRDDLAFDYDIVASTTLLLSGFKQYFFYFIKIIQHYSAFCGLSYGLLVYQHFLFTELARNDTFIFNMY